jgi:peptide methionine sulfoxide reductase MsrB
MARATPSAPLVITLVGGLVLLCGGLVVMTEYAKVELKKRDETREQESSRPAAAVNPYKEKLYKEDFTAFARAYLREDDPSSSGRYVNTSEPGTYLDIASGEPVFSSSDKLEPAFGYAEFSRPLDPARLVEEAGVIEGEQRLNVMGRTSGARLGWIVPGADGLRRYVINSSVLKFVPEKGAAADGTAAEGIEAGQK